MQNFVVIAIVFCVSTVCASTDDVMDLYKVDTGKCMDGSSAAYYHRASEDPQSTLWVINLEGGGACHDKQNCIDRSKGHLGSSKGYASTKTNIHDILSSNATKNPDFHKAHTIHVPYCSSDTHRGQQTEATEETWNLYFSGHLNLVAIVDDVRSKFPVFEKAEHILLTGNSAGGVGTIFNADWMASVAPASATVKAAPLAGWFFGGNYPDQIATYDAGWSPPSLYDDFKNGVATDTDNSSTAVANLWKGYVSDACAKAEGSDRAHRCGTAHVAYHYVETPVFVMENMYDTNQLSAQGGLPKSDFNTPEGQKYIQYLGRGIRNSTSSLKKGDGIFLASCLDHGGGLGVGGTTTIDDINSGTMLGDWFWNRPDAVTSKRDTCDEANGGLPCNPTCHGNPAPSGSCAAELEKVCPAASYGSVQACGNCAKSHTSALEGAGCTYDAVRSACRARQ